MRPIKYTDGSNGIVRLPASLWRAFYEAALYMDYPSVQECFIDFLNRKFTVYDNLDFVMIVELLEGYNPPDVEDVPF